MISFFIALIISMLLPYLIYLTSPALDKYSGYLLTPLFISTFVISFFVLTRRIVKDLMTLERGLQIIAQGNLDHRVSVVRRDELGRVAWNINVMTERLQQLMNKERELEYSKMELITGISHDLRTPLTSMIGYIDLLKTRSYQSEEEYNRFVQNTYSKAIHLKSMLDDLFDYTRLTSQEVVLNLRDIDVGKLLEQLLFEFEPIANEHGVTIERRLELSPSIVPIDSEKIARAIDNLLMNALKYSVKPGFVHIRLNKETSHIRIEIENKGTPLDDDQVGKLFDRFYKVDHARSNEGIQTGAGLGLSIAKNIIVLHGGTLLLDHSNGTYTFRLTLPS